ncbi:MAG: ATP-binding cassette domain-containing protein [Oscillospiraceae bacterium]|nr:ATP-binding cassette domain-containing protein [Oscillospiraceae bacterium]
MSLIVDIRKDMGAFRLEAAFRAENGITSLLGPSGCGKSLTLKCIAGIERPDEGHIELDGRVLFDSAARIDLPPQRRQVGYLFQNYALFPNMTLRQNILCGLHRLPDRLERESRCREILGMMRLEGLEGHKPHQLSGGQQQRAALARILVNEPRLLMLDEPFSALDAHLRDSLKIELRDRLRDFGREVLMVTHSREEAYTMSDSIAVMDKGRLLAHKPTKALFADPGSVAAAVMTGCKNIAPARKVGDCEVEVPSWGVRLKTARPVGEGLAAVGIRAHYFNAATSQGRYPVIFVEEMEEPFETTIQFRYAGQDPQSPPIWWRMPKDKRPAQFPAELGVAPANILLLYE